MVEKQYTRLEIGEKISNAIIAKKCGSGIEQNIRCVLQSIPNANITNFDATQVYGRLIPMRSGAHVTLSNETPNGNRECQFVPGMIIPSRILKFDCSVQPKK